MVLIITFLAQAFASTGGPTCSVNSDSFADLVSNIETKARLADHQLCADVPPDASVDTQSKLLRLIRDRAVARLSQSGNKTFDAKSMAVDHARLRAFQSLRHSTIIDGPNGLQLSPAVSLAMPAGFPSAQPLRPADVGRLNSVYAKEVGAVSSKVGDARGLERRRRITQFATPLQEELRATGEIGFNETISANPSTLFVSSAQPSEDELKVAHQKFSEEVSGAAAKLRAMKLKDIDEGLGLIFYGPALKESLKESPDLCGAYNSLRERVRSTENFRAYANAGMAIASGGACLLAGALSGGTLLSACLALSTGEFGTAALSARASFREKELLYGGLMQGSSVADYEAKHSEGQNYLLLAGLSGSGALGAAGGVARTAQAARTSAAADNALIEKAHLVGLGEVGQDGQLAGIGNYTLAQKREKLKILKERFNRDQRRSLFESGAVGIDDPKALQSATDQLRALQTMSREQIDSKTLRGLEQKLEACTKTTKTCEQAYKAIAQAYESERSLHVRRVEDLERRLTAKAEETSDEKHFDELTEALERVGRCKQNPGLPECRETLIEAERHVPLAKVALKGPAPNPAQPYLSQAKPVDEVSKLKFLTQEQRNNLARMMNQESKNPDAIHRAKMLAAESTKKFTSIDDLNAVLLDLLGPDVRVYSSESKVHIESTTRPIRVTLDPTSRYFTVQKDQIGTAKALPYARYRKDQTGRLVPDYSDLSFEERVTYSHFGY